MGINIETYIYFTKGGVPQTGLSPTFEHLLTTGDACGGASEAGTDKSGSAPTIYEIGGGFYKFDVAFGAAPWDVTARGLVAAIDGGSALADIERYKPVILLPQMLALARLGHKAVQDKSTGTIELYSMDGVTVIAELTLSDDGSDITRTMVAP